MIFRTSCEVNRMGLGVCVRALELHLFRKDLAGKTKAKTGIGKSDFPGLQGGPRKRDFVFTTNCARLGSIPTPVRVEQTGRKRVLPFTGRLVGAKRTQQGSRP